MNSKWGRKYWVDLSERVGTTGIYGLIAILTGDKTGAIVGSADQWWVIVGLPTVLSFLKGILVNLGGEEPSASIANVTSNGQ